MFLKTVLTTMGDIVKAKSDIERLKFLPQRVEDGKIITFKGKTFGGKLDVPNMTIIKADRVTEATRYTTALQRDYFDGLNKLLAALSDEEPTTETPVEVPADPYQELYNIIEAGDRKAFRSYSDELRKKWFAMGDDEVEDMLEDLLFCVKDKDVEGAKDLLVDFGDPDKVEVKDDETESDERDVEADDNDQGSTQTSDQDEVIKEIIQDIKSAIDDGDKKDFLKLLEELKDEDESLYNEWKDKFIEGDDSDSEIDDICADIDDAISDGELDEAKDYLEELAEVAGKDSEVYINYSAKLEPKKSRRSRRGK